MPGYVIHIAVACEYYNKHKSQIKNYDSFIKGVINPDIAKKIDKSSHKIRYDKENLNDFDLGKIVHIYTDKCFYKKFKWNPGFYKDYDRTNKYYIKKYNIKIPNVIMEEIKFSSENPKNFSFNQIDEFIDDMSSQDLLNEYTLNYKKKNKIK